MKVAINKCYGGFDLSPKAKTALYEKGCKHTQLVPYTRDILRDLYPPYKGKGIQDDHDTRANRTCPNLISVIESMGREANGKFGNIKVVEIPDGIEWEINEYDGIEWVDEKHRTWG